MALTKILTEGIKDGEIKDADINSSAAIAKTKLASLDIVNADINSSAAIATSKISGLATSATTDTTNASNISSGTLPDARYSIELSRDTTPQLGGDLDTNSNHILLDDDHNLKFGNDTDLEIFHQNSNQTNIINSHKPLETFSNGNTTIKTNNGHIMIKAQKQGAVELYYDNSQKFLTTSSGAQFNGVLRCDDGNGASGSYATFGDDGDLQIYHDGTNSRIRNTISGKPLLIQNIGGDTRVETLGNFLVDSWEGESIAKFNRNGNVQLYNDNVLKFETKDYGINVEGTNSVNTQIKIHNNDVIGRSYWGYSTGYNGTTVGRTDNSVASTIFMGVDVTSNQSGSFAGNGSEIVFRNNHIFKTPNAANNNYVTPFRFGRATSTEGAVNFPQGLMFGADQADANILDDYEEGIHVMAPSGTSDFAISASYDEAPYTKIGRLVTIRGLIYISGITGSGGYVRVTLPFTAANDQAGVRYSGNIGTVMHNGVNTGDAGVVAYISGNSNRMGFYKVSDNSSWSHLVASDLTVGDEMYFTISYEV